MVETEAKQGSGTRACGDPTHLPRQKQGQKQPQPASSVEGRRRVRLLEETEGASTVRGGRTCTDRSMRRSVGRSGSVQPRANAAPSPAAAFSSRPCRREEPKMGLPAVGAEMACPHLANIKEAKEEVD
jgi:hypothetical protein